LIENTFEGQLDTGKLISSLWSYCAKLGVKILTGIKVKGIEEHDDSISIQTNQLTFQASQVAICTNAFSNELLGNKIDLNPGRGMVLAVKPQKPHRLKGTFHYDEGYYYFRDYYDKVIFGGGRNIDLEMEKTKSFGINEQIKHKLIEDLSQIILPNQDYQIEMEWSGIMAFGQSKEPIIQRISDRQVIGVRLGGMGVAIGSLVGEKVATLCLENFKK